MESWREDGGRHGPHIHHIQAGEDEIQLRHYPVRSLEQMKRKYIMNAKALKAANMENSGASAHSEERGAFNDEQMEKFYYSNCFSKDPIKEKLIYDGGN